MRVRRFFAVLYGGAIGVGRRPGKMKKSTPHAELGIIISVWLWPAGDKYAHTRKWRQTLQRDYTEQLAENCGCGPDVEPRHGRRCSKCAVPLPAPMEEAKAHTCEVSLSARKNGLCRTRSAESGAGRFVCGAAMRNHPSMQYWPLATNTCPEQQRKGGTRRLPFY